MTTHLLGISIREFFSLISALSILLDNSFSKDSFPDEKRDGRDL